MILLVNPAAGAGRARLAGQAAAQLLRERGVPFAVWQTRGPDHARHLAQKAAARGERLVLVTGGDGTLWEAAQGLMAPPAPWASCPPGRATTWPGPWPAPADGGGPPPGR